MVGSSLEHNSSMGATLPQGGLGGSAWHMVELTKTLALAGEGTVMAPLPVASRSF